MKDSIIAAVEQITLGDISAWLAFIVALGGSVAAIVGAVKKILKKLFDEQMTAINARMDAQEASIKKIDLENCKNFLVSFLAKAEWDSVADEIERQRFWEEYQHYTESGGNSYIKEKVNKLQKAGKL